MKYSATCLLTVLGLFSVNSSEARTRYLNPQDTMCELDETIYISCSLDAGPTPNDYSGPIASVCAKDNASPDSGYVQYRYGIPGESIQSLYPKEKAPPQGKLKIYETADGVGASLRFRDGDKVYAFEDYGFRGYRFIVTVGKREIINKRCDDPGVTHITDSAYIGIEKSGSKVGP